ncbi:MAG: hypothetical protein EBQ80_00970 [Proteobacteria bacterium]|nr:hypothetical protein [Pseudomonadota bacterium]
MQAADGGGGGEGGLQHPIRPRRDHGEAGDWGDDLVSTVAVEHTVFACGYNPDGVAPGVEGGIGPAATGELGQCGSVIDVGLRVG